MPVSFTLTELQQACEAVSGTTILLEDGTYDLLDGDFSSRLSFNAPNVTLRSLSGNRDAVILDGAYGTNELTSIHASNVTTEFGGVLWMIVAMLGAVYVFLRYAKLWELGRSRES